MLGVFQKLVASKAHDHEGFHILSTLVESLDYQGTLAQVMPAHPLTCGRLPPAPTTPPTRGRS